MFHPLLGDARDLKDLELENKILELSKKYHIAARMGQGGVANQIAIALDMYKSEQYRRQIETVNNLVNKEDKDLDDLINVD
jgi:hypothetical protein